MRVSQGSLTVFIPFPGPRLAATVDIETVKRNGNLRQRKDIR
jgi:hypothetical protein